jgi:hypothetical protein
MIVADPKKCPQCQSKHWRAKDVIEATSDRVLAEMVEYGQSHNFPCVLSPAWDKDNVGDIREDILTSISDGWKWGNLIRDFLMRS